MEPWRARLQSGDGEGAWTLFLARYHRLIGATIGRIASDPDDALDVFAHVCERLSDDDFARLRRFHDTPGHCAKFSTWLVAVVRNLAVDWRRARDGRPRLTPPPGLSALRQRIYEVVLVERRTHVEAYEMLRSGVAEGLSFGGFLRELTATYRAVDARRWSSLALLHERVEDPETAAVPPSDRLERAEDRSQLARAMAELTAEERTAIQLFVVEERSAAEVARAVGWPNAKSVYNRVSRALAAIRARLAADASGESKGS